MFVRSYNPVWYFVNNTGVQMDDTYYFFVLQNTFPYLPATVYHDNQGQIPWSSPIQVLSNGTLPTDIFYDPGEVYRLEWRAGNTQSDLLVYEVNDYVPDSTEITPGGDSAVASDNFISNPQFAFVDFDPEFTATVAGTYQIAPGWFLELVGESGGTITITQEAVAGEENFPGNPPYVLSIDSDGWTEVNLYQQFDRVSGIWANTSINATLTGIAETFDVPISILYYPSTGTPRTIVDAEILNTASYRVISGGVTLEDSENSDSGEDAFVRMVIVLPPDGNIKISNVQLVTGNSVLENDPTSIAYIQEPIERQQDHLYHWYADSILTQSKNNILTGWDFSLNPFQFGNTAVTTFGTKCGYKCDQTILYQPLGSQIQAGQNTDANRENLVIKAVAASTDNRFCVIQYVDPDTIRPYWGSKVSCLVKLLLTTTHNTSIRFKMRLLYRRSLPTQLSDTDPVLSWPKVVPAVDPTFAAGWTEIIPLNDPEYLIPTTTASGGLYNDYPAFSFDQFQLPDNTTVNDTLAVVLYTMDQMDSTSGTQDSINFQSISMTRNDFAIDVSPLTWDETMQRCRFYYEKSYEISTQPGTATDTGRMQISMPCNNTTGGFYRRTFQINYMNTKRISPNVTLYSTDGTINTVRCFVIKNGSAVGTTVNQSGWSIGNNSYDRCDFIPSDSTTILVAPGFDVGNEPLIRFHYVADSRLGR